jgi:hypothetical protein
VFFSSLRLGTGCFLLVFATGVSAFSYTLSVSEQALQDHLSAIKPMEKRSHFYRISLSHPQVDLIEGSDRIHFSIQISLSILGAIQSQGLVKVSGKVEYNPETSQFFLIQPTVEAIEIAHIPIATVEKIQAVIQKIVGKALTKVEVFQLHDRDVKQKMLKAVLQSVVVSQDEQLLITLKAF